MFRNSLSWYILTLSLLDFITKTHPTLHDSSHGFIGKSSRYFDDDFAHLHEEISSLVSGISDIALNLQLKFEPSSLDFKQRPLGIPHLEKVTLFNTDNNKTIDMTSISGSTVHFHSSFFEDKKVVNLAIIDTLKRNVKIRGKNTKWFYKVCEQVVDTNLVRCDSCLHWFLIQCTSIIKASENK